MTQNNSWGQKGEFSLYVLALIDCIERLDTLMFEARNLQVNIINILREPGLYLPLRYEESYIFGQEYSVNFREVTSNHIFCEKCGKLIDEWIIRYPAPGKCNTFPETETEDESEQKKLEKRLKIIVKRMWFTGTWGEEQRRYYYFLRAVQSLKRKIFYDKTVLCHFAENEAKINTINNNKRTLEREQALFMIFRRAVLKRSIGYLKRLRDIQYQFSKAMDTGLQDNPRPNIERRRELGIYMNFLSDRCRDLRQDMSILLEHCGVDIKEDHTTILHSWTHEYTSTNAHLTDNLTPFETDYYIKRSDQDEIVEFVNTNYWMPDRPSLQPIIAHEIAHGVLRKHLDNLRDSAIQKGDDAFTELLLMLSYCIKDMENMGLDFNIYSSPHRLLQEIACDFLGGAVKGFSYLYAEFLDTVGYDLEKMLCLDELGVPEIGMIHHTDFRFDINLSVNGGPPFPDWYFRLYLLTVWLECIHHHKLSSLDSMLVEGVRRILDNLFEQLLSTSHSDGLSAKIWTDRKGLIERLGEIVENSRLVQEVKKWRKKRENDHRNQSTGDIGPKTMPRHVQGLPPAVIKLLCNQRRDKMVERLDQTESLSDEERQNQKFNERYGINILNQTNSSSDLFSHLYQIPWQSALMRGIDFYETCFHVKEQQNNEFWDDIHFDCSLGRDRFTFAMDFRYWSTASPTNRLDRTISLVKHHKHGESPVNGSENDEEININKALDIWLDNKFDDKKELNRKFEKITQQVKKFHQLDDKYKKKIIECIKDVKNVSVSISEDEKKKNWELLQQKQDALKNIIEIMCEHADKISHSMKSNDEKKKERSNKSITEQLACIMEPTIICKVLSTYSFTYHELRYAEEIAGYKLVQLCELLNKYCEKTKGRQCGNRIFPLYSFLSERKKLCDQLMKPQTGNDASHAILKAFRITCNGNNTNSRHWWSYLLGRISVSGSYIRMLSSIYNSHESDNEAARFSDLEIKGEYFYDDSIIQNSKFSHPVRQHSLLGRYDIIQGTNVCSMSRCFLPHFIMEETTPKVHYSVDEKFFSFFVRREIAFPAKIHYEGNTPIELPWTSSERKCLLAVIAITLQKRSYRLDMLARLLRSNQGIPCKKTNPRFVEELYFEQEDVAYLTDGWGDILLFLHGPVEKSKNNTKKYIEEHIHRIAETQNVLFEDFMTDRTELIPTPYYLNMAARLKRRGVNINNLPEEQCNLKFRIASRVRLMEDRLLWQSNKLFTESINNNKDSSTIPNCCSETNCESYEEGKCPVPTMQLSRIPGRLDFHIHFTPSEENNQCTNFMHTITKLLDHKCVDRIDTSIGIEYGPFEKR